METALALVSFLLAIIALVPYCLEIYFYFAKKPKFNIQIACKKIASERKKRIFDFWLGVQSLNVSLILKRVILTLPFDIHPEQYPGYTKPLRIAMPLEKSNSLINLLLDSSDDRYHPKFGTVYMIRTVFEKDISEFKTLLTIEVEIDPFNLGFWSIFYGARKYRKQRSVNIQVNETNQHLII